MPPVRHLIDTRGPDHEAVRTAVGLLVDYCEAHPAQVRNAILLTSTKQNLRNPVPAEALGSHLVSALLSGSGAKLPNGALLKHQTLRTIPVYPEPDAVIVLYATNKALDYVDDLQDARIVIVVPWTPDDVQTWRETWAPIVNGRATERPGSPIVKRVVVAALESLTSLINHSTGLSHPSDAEAARDTLWILLQNSEWASPSSMRAWAMQNGWTSSGANDLQALAERISSSPRKPKGAGSFLGAEAIHVWRERAKGEGA